MNEQKIAGLIGLALRARQAVSGADACRLLIRSGECGVLLVDGDAGPNTRKKAEEQCRSTETPMRILPAGTIERATGRSNRLLAVRKGGFAIQLCEITGKEE